MKNACITLDRISHSISLAFVAVFWLFISEANAEPIGQLQEDIVTLSGAPQPGAFADLFLIGGATSPYIVPTNRTLILTDVIVSPQSFPPTGAFLWAILSTSSDLTTDLVVTSTAADPSSFQLHLRTGMVFHAGSKVRISLYFASSGVNVTALGCTCRR